MTIPSSGKDEYGFTLWAKEPIYNQLMHYFRTKWIMTTSENRMFFFVFCVFLDHQHMSVNNKSTHILDGGETEDNEV